MKKQVKKQVLGDYGLRTKHQGPRTKHNSLWTFVCQVADEAADFSMGLRCLFVDLVKLILRDVGLIKSCVELTFYLGAGPLGITQKPSELCITSTVEAFCNVVHGRA